MHIFICISLISMWLLQSDLAIHPLCGIIVIFILFGIGAKGCDFFIKRLEERGI